jgi:hypothetical protein
LESLCPLSSSLADGGAQSSAKKVFLQLLEQYAVEGSEFLHSIMTGDKSWFHHFNPGRK